MAKVKSNEIKGLAAWLPNTKMKDSIEYQWCSEHGLQEVNFFGIYACTRNLCIKGFKVGRLCDMTELDKLIYGIEDAGTK